jgi:exopolyphosphatase/guanosine-5'-triphosphate,3'-diphosphate pyrophosphatase
VRRAVIDVGTNSVKLLVAEVEGHEVRPVSEQSKQTRLGSGFYDSHRLQDGAIKATAEAVGKFAGIAREQQAESIRVIATSAAREAANAKQLISAIHAACGLEVEVISGEEEADLAFQGVTSDPALAKTPLLLLDVGGGSTEFILGEGSRKHFRASFPVGTVRLLERFPHGDPPLAEELTTCRTWLKDFLEKEVRPQLDPALRQDVRAQPQDVRVKLIGTGGTTTILARMEGRMEGFDRAEIENTRLSREQVSQHVKRLWSLPLDERRQIVGLPPNRADVILVGAAIYEAVMNVFEFEELRISTRGLRFAAVLATKAKRER